MSNWAASIVFDDPPQSGNLRVIQGVAERYARNLETVIPVHIGSKQAVRTAPTKAPRRDMGYWRATTDELEGTANSICLKSEGGPTEPTDLWVTIEFFDAEIGWLAVHYERDCEGFVHHVCTHDRENQWEHTWINTADTQTWQRATIPLTAAVLNGSGPLGCDIEIEASGSLAVREVSVSTERPADTDATDLDAHAERVMEALSARYTHPDAEVSVGNIASIFEESDIQSAQDVAPWLPIYRATGVTSIQSYVRWATVEKVEGEWKWGIYDWVFDIAKRFKLKWVAFIMIGPHYAMPDWWLKAGNDFRNRCLEHNEDSWVQSIWSPVMLDAVDRFMQEFSRHYDHDMIESIMLGIAGDFGESTTNGVFIRKLYHTHVGHWCGEDIAVTDFQESMRTKYEDIRSLNDAWQSDYAAFDQLRPTTREEVVSDRAWLDQMNWYVDRMTWLMERWGEITRKALPETPIYNAAGGAGDPPRAASWSAQSKALVPTGVGHRATNEGHDYAFNFAYTSWIGVSCRHYGLPFGNEPWGGDMSGNGVLGRIYNAVLYDAQQYWFYQNHIRPASGRLALERGLKFADGTYKRRNRVAVYYPWTHFLLKDEHGFAEKARRDVYWPQVEELRDILDFDLIDCQLVADGIMSEYDFLIVLQGVTYEQDELERLVKWVESGGIVITHNIGVPATVEGDTALGRALTDFTESPGPNGSRVAAVGEGRVVMHPTRADLTGWRRDNRWADDHPDHPATNKAFWRTVTATLAGASSLRDGLADYPVIDGGHDLVYAAICEHEGEEGILYFSQNEADATLRPIIPGKGECEVRVPSGELIFVPFRELG